MSQEGEPPEEVVWQFLFTQWPAVAQEVSEHVGQPQIWLLKDVPAMEAAVRRAAPTMFPLTWHDALESVVEQLKKVGKESDWRTN